MTFLLRSASICLSVISFGTHAVAQDGPSYVETVKYISERTQATSSSADGKTKYTFETYFPARCELRIKYRVFYQNQNYDNTKIDYKVDLKELDPTEVTSSTESSRVIVGVRERRQAVYWFNLGEKRSGYDERVLMGVSSEFDPARVGKAMAHLIKFCGGKKELF